MIQKGADRQMSIRIQRTHITAYHIGVRHKFNVGVPQDSCVVEPIGRRVRQYFTVIERVPFRIVNPHRDHIVAAIVQ
ncbi:hypothetical protein D3C76_1569200 [compost metagenome]